MNPTEFVSGWDPTWQNVPTNIVYYSSINLSVLTLSISSYLVFENKHIKRRRHDESSPVMDDAIHKLSCQIKYLLWCGQIMLVQANVKEH